MDDGRAVSEEVLGTLPQARRYTAPLQLDPADPLAVVVNLTDAPDAPLPGPADGQGTAVLLVDTGTDQVIGVDDVARDLAPGVTLPVSVAEWFQEAGLQDVVSSRTRDAFSVTEIPLHGDSRAAGGALLVLSPSSHPLTRAAASTDGVDGRIGRVLLTLSEALTATTTVRQIAATITDVVAAELGAAGGGLLLADAGCTGLDFVTLGDMPTGTDTAWAHIDWNSDAPLAAAARTRRSSFYSDSAAMLAAHPSLVAQAQLPVMGASASLPLVAGDTVLGAVFLYWDQPHVVLEQQQEILAALARYCAQAVQRATLIAERRTTAEVLQYSLMTRLPEPDHLELRARYVAAAAEEHVGGDWYDAVVVPDGGTTVIIGDVTGHDMVAAAEMGQLRGLLRAFAFDRQDPPADIVSRLDRAVAGLHVDTLATLVLARIEQTEDDERSGWRRVRWTNAGHPPPILLHADGTTEVLATPPEVLVGLLDLAPGAGRSDHVHGLPPGSTLLLFTDGLVEHRGRSIDDGYDDLCRVLAASADRPVQELLDHVVAELVGEFPDDDCAILAVRAHREDRPRPAEAGPNTAESGPDTADLRASP